MIVLNYIRQSETTGPQTTQVIIVGFVFIKKAPVFFINAGAVYTNTFNLKPNQFYIHRLILWVSTWFQWTTSNFPPISKSFQGL